jgi:hypothetical protein
MTEPTEPVNYTPYEPTSPSYGDIPPIPPPPPPNTRRPWWHIGVPILMGVALVTLILVPNIALSKPPAHTLATHFDPGATAAAQAGATQAAAETATASVPTPTPTIAPTPTPTKNPNYTAKDIIQAFQAAGLPTDRLTYLDAISNRGITAIQAQSYAFFDDPSLCGGFNCGEDTVSIDVYATAIDAATVYQQFERWIQYPTGPDRNEPYQAGRCFMNGEPLTTVYVQIVKADCV